MYICRTIYYGLKLWTTVRGTYTQFKLQARLVVSESNAKDDFITKYLNYPQNN